MLFANIVFGLPIEGPFDYAVPEQLQAKIRKGMRAIVNFNNKKLTGYIVALSDTSKIKQVKPILDMPDEHPILASSILRLTKELSLYYGCSWGEAIETAMPQAIRNSKRRLELTPSFASKNKTSANITLIHDPGKQQRWEIYLKEIKNTLNSNKSVLFLNTDLDKTLQAQNTLAKSFNSSIALLHRRMNVAKSTENWLNIKNQKANIVLGVISAVFAPLENLGLIIIDEEQSQNYKNDQTPHYNSRDVALMRAELEGTNIILASSSPSLEMLKLTKNKKISYLLTNKSSSAQIQIIDTRRKSYAYNKKDSIISTSLQVALNQALENKGKILLFVNKKGFASFAHCNNCNFTLRCPRCNIGLTYHFKENELICHYCNHIQEAPMICPQCNSGYIRYSGSGIEKIESELHRLYPNAKIKKIERPEDLELSTADIFIASQIALKVKNLSFDLVGIISVDNILNRIDFRSAEKTFSLLVGLLNLADKNFYIQTNVPTHYCFQALAQRNFNLFYENELALRKQLDFPPFKHFIYIKIRGKDLDKVENRSKDLFAALSKNNKLRALNVAPAQPAKLRDNFYWQILVKTATPKNSVKLIKERLKEFTHSGLIITIDTDPV